MLVGAGRVTLCGVHWQWQPPRSLGPCARWCNGKWHKLSASAHGPRYTNCVRSKTDMLHSRVNSDHHALVQRRPDKPPRHRADRPGLRPGQIPAQDESVNCGWHRPSPATVATVGPRRLNQPSAASPVTGPANALHSAHRVPPQEWQRHPPVW